MSAGSQPDHDKISIAQLLQSFVVSNEDPSSGNSAYGTGAIGNGLSSPNNNNNNNGGNYVDFNQFIMQHNFYGGPPPPVTSILPNSAADNQMPMPSLFSVLPNNSTLSNQGFDHGYSGIPQASANKTSTTSFDEYQQRTNFFKSNLNPFQYNNENSSENNSSLYSNDGHHSYEDPSQNYYTPFGNTSTTYFGNPFGNPFAASSNLQATAPEFVPRINNLSLNENSNNNGMHGSNTEINGHAVVSAMEKLNIEASVYNINSNSTPHGSSFAEQIKLNILPTSNNLKKTKDAANEPIKLTADLFKNAVNSHSSTTLPLINTSKTTLRAEYPLRASSSNGFSGHNNGRLSNNSTKFEKSTASAKAERERERDNRRYSNGRRSAVEFNERDSGYERIERGGADRQDRSDRGDRNERNYTRGDRGERNDRGGDRGERIERGDRGDRFERGERGERIERGERGERRGRDYHQRFDNNRSNKRRDDWNRNRDRISGFRVEEKYSTDDNGMESPMVSPEKKPSPKKVYPENEKLSQREKLMRDIEMRRLECLVCVEPIKAHHSVWSCNNCYHILHLQCIVKWASSSKSEDGWRCPACQNVVKEVPRDYYCFCGRVKNPQSTRHDIAHSCGEVCGRVDGCVHACTLLCHPGPCPPCQANVQRECGCGKTVKTMQCCLKQSIVCDSTCGKLLNCELHSCIDICHDGKCTPCGEKVAQICHCSKQEREVACTRDSHDKLNYACGKPCGKELSCGNHKCKDCCHAGPCRICKQSPEVITSCPCGKMPVKPEHRSSCLDPIPVCDAVCGKTLRCGKAAHPHHCVSKCHLGNCPPCNKQTAVKCRCGHMDQMIKCRQLSTRADDARCKKRCTKKRICGRHKCNQECCIDIDHICPLPCNYTLSCGKHKCDQPCHRGNCPPCYRSSFEELYCECGAEVIYPPVACGTKRPVCKRACSRTHPCDHPPQHNCHAATSCPPCMMFSTKWCFGHHEQRKTIPCSQASFSCGLSCNKKLSCGRHNCIKSCHEGPCEAAGDICKQNCVKIRQVCEHKCMSSCHDGDCPETQCKEMVEVQCECGNRKQMRACHDLAREYSRIATAQFASFMAEMQRGNYMELSEIMAPVKMNKSSKTLDCNDECRLLERNRRLAIGLQIRNPDMPQKLLTKYSDFIRNFAKRDSVLVKSIHDALTTLVKLAKESKQKSRSHSFPTMNREKRQLVHEMCEMFGVESVAYDAEPNRNVVATAFREKSWLPATSIMEVMQRESGQRRVPVPSNNAWGMKR